MKNYAQGVYWSIKQIEHSLDIVFKSEEALRPIYERISREAVLAVRVPEIARFWDKKRIGQPGGSDHKTMVEATRIKHVCGKQSLKMYDKGGRVLRIEVTSNDVSFYKHHREVAGRDGRARWKNAALRKSIHSLGVLRKLMGAVCKRYLEYVGQLEHSACAQTELSKISEPARDGQKRSQRGFNLFLREDLEVIRAIVDGAHRRGMSSKTLRAVLAGKSRGQMGRILRRLRLHGLIKKVGRTYRYYLTKLGSRVLVAACRLRENLIMPALAGQPAGA